jgi:hypothetical protein
MRCGACCKWLSITGIWWSRSSNVARFERINLELEELYAMSKFIVCDRFFFWRPTRFSPVFRSKVSAHENHVTCWRRQRYNWRSAMFGLRHFNVWLTKTPTGQPNARPFDPSGSLMFVHVSGVYQFWRRFIRSAANKSPLFSGWDWTPRSGIDLSYCMAGNKVQQRQSLLEFLDDMAYQQITCSQLFSLQNSTKVVSKQCYRNI